MKLISVNSLKGGVGKSTITSVLLNSLSLDFGYKCLLIEADRQRSLSDIRLKRDRPKPEDTIPYEIRFIAPEKVHVELVKMKQTLKDVDLVFIELPGFFDENIEKAVRLCDSLLIPWKPSDLDLLALERFIYGGTEQRQAKEPSDFQKIISYKKTQEEELIVYTMLNQIKLNVKDHAIYKEFVKTKLKIDVMDSSLRDLEIYKKQTTMTSYADISQIKDEVNTLVKEFIEKFEIPVKQPA